MLTNVTHCARCGEDHTDVLFTKLGGQAVEGVTHWGMCPTLNQPILMEVRQTPPAPVLLNAANGTTNPLKGSITRQTSPTSSLFDNTPPWVATCGVCHKSEELGQGCITAPQTATDKGWLNSDRLGWVCGGCQKFMKPTDNCWLTSPDR